MKRLFCIAVICFFLIPMGFLKISSQACSMPPRFNSEVSPIPTVITNVPIEPEVKQEVVKKPEDKKEELAKTKVYGKSGLGTELEVVTIGNGSKVLLAVFEIHGFEDHHKKDGQILVDIGKQVIEHFKNKPEDLNGWTLAVVCSANPDGLAKGTTNNGPGRCQISKGIDINRDFDYHFKYNKGSRNKTLQKPFSSPEAAALRDLVLELKPSIVLDFHGWLKTTYGDQNLSKILKKNLSIGFAGTQKGSGYFTSWTSTKKARSVLVEYGYGNKKNTEGTINSLVEILKNEGR